MMAKELFTDLCDMLDELQANHGDRMVEFIGDHAADASMTQRIEIAYRTIRLSLEFRAVNAREEDDD